MEVQKEEQQIKWHSTVYALELSVYFSLGGQEMLMRK